MSLTHRSFSTIIAWMSTCLLAGGFSTLFSDSIRSLWMLWGCFGLVAAVGLDMVARLREKLRAEELRRVADRRLDKGFVTTSVDAAIHTLPKAV